MNKVMKEVVLWIIIVIPFIYLWMLWDDLPQKVATHFNIKGEADDWSDKTTLIYLPCLLGLGIYVLMLIVPRIDPKKKLDQMGGKYYNIRFLTMLFISAISVYVLYTAKAGGMTGINFFLLLSGVFFAALGNYLQAVRPNYFVGLRTPWTLENEEVWRNTHRMGGKIWMAGGLLIVLLSLLIREQKSLAIVFGIIMFIMVLIPVVYSYVDFRRIKSRAESSQ
jgi:uncharacterized membrane protein